MILYREEYSWRKKHFDLIIDALKTYPFAEEKNGYIELQQFRAPPADSGVINGHSMINILLDLFSKKIT